MLRTAKVNLVQMAALGAALLGKDIVKKAAAKGLPPERKERTLREIKLA